MGTVPEILLLFISLYGVGKPASGYNTIWRGDCGLLSAPLETSVPSWLTSLRKPRDIRQNRYFNYDHYAGAALIRLKRGREESDIAITSGFYCKKIFRSGEGHVAVFGASNILLRGGLLSVPITECHAHPNYNSLSDVGSDIGIIKLKWPVVFNEHINPVCLPEVDDLDSVGTVGVIAGWEKQKTTMHGLRHIQLRVVPQDACHRSPQQHQNEGVCLDGSKESQGHSYLDAGAPFVRTVNGRGVMIGVASHFWTDDEIKYAYHEVMAAARFRKLNAIDAITKDYLLNYIFPSRTPPLPMTPDWSRRESHRGLAVYARLPTLVTRLTSHIHSGWIEETIRDTSLLWTKAAHSYTRRGTCGQPAAPPTRSIKHPGVAAARNQPWLISTRRRGVFHYGTAALIRASEDQEKSDMAITTALTCKEIGDNDFATFGSYDMTIENAPGFPIEYCVPHPEYNPASSDVNGINDIGIIKLSHPIIFSDDVKPLCLPQADEDLSYGATGLLAAWGGPRGATHLRQIDLEVLEPKHCGMFYTGDSDDTVACVGSEASGAITGLETRDSGSPFVTKMGGSYALGGIAMWRNAGRHKFPTLVQRVAPFIRSGWIQETIMENTEVH